MRWEIANLVIASVLAGLIWTVQLVVYPAFALVGSAEWPRYGAQHRRRITWLAAPLMTANVTAALVLVVQHAEALRVLNAVLAAAIFAVTGLAFTRMHARIERTAGTRAVRLLVRANWVRTVAWTAQVVVAIALI